MIRISQHRHKCIGCNYCVELAPDRWRMSKKDGKSILLGAREKRGFYHVETSEVEFEANQRAAEACPVKIIKVNLL